MELELSSLATESLPLFAAAAIGGILLLLLFQRLFFVRKRRLPPGPRPWPIVGNLHLMGPLKHQIFKELADEYGPIVYLRLGSVDVVVVSSPEPAEEILKTKDLIFASRPATSYGKIVSRNNSSTALSPYGPYWRHARKVYSQELLTARRIQDFQEDRRNEVIQALGTILEECKDGKPTTIRHTLWTLTSSNICRMAFSKTFSGDDSNSFSDAESHLYESCVVELNKLLSVFVPGDSIPLLRPFDVHGYKKRMRNVARQLAAFLDGIVEEHLQKVKLQQSSNADADHGKKDLVDVLLTRTGHDNETQFTLVQVKSLIQEILAGGTDTSITTLTWAMAELHRNPSTLKEAQLELDDVVGRDRLVAETDLPRLPYLQAIVKETFRLHPVGPLLLPHETFEASTLGKEGYYIPKKCRVFVNTWAMGRDPALWENPLEFRPERFLNGRIDTNGQTYKFLPFGSGRRICPGRHLAVTLVEYSLAAFLHACDWALPNGMKPEDLDMAEAPGVTVPKMVPLQTVATPRLPLSVIFMEK